MSEERNAARVTGAFAISRLSPQLVRDVVTPEVLERFQLSGRRTLQLSDSISLDLEEFNAAVASAALHGSASLAIKDGSESVNCDVSVEDDGAVVLQTPAHRWRIAHAALLSMDVRRRREALSQVLQRHTLHSKVRAEVARTVEKESLTNEELLGALKSLNASPESFLQQLAPRLQGGQSQVTDFLPEESSYWANITASCEQSKSLPEFITHELAEERAARIREDVKRGFVTISYSFAATELVPLDWLKGVDANVIVQGVESVVSSTDDPLALAGAFEICADAISRDERLGPWGEKILDKLFADPEGLVRRCKFFSALFVIASAQLATHAETREKPAFWRRLAAAAHVGWVMRACGSANVDESKFLRWVMRERGQEYMLSAFHDMREEPRWQPEWIDAEFLVPDVLGRTYFMLLKLASGAPSGWSDRIEKMKRWIQDQQWDARMYLPSVLQGSRQREMPRLDEQMASDMRAAFDEFSRAPSLDGLLGLASWIEFVGLGAEAIPGAKKVLQQLRTDADEMREGKQLAAIAVSTRLAVVNSDRELAQAVADTYLERFRSEGGDLSITQLVFQLVECAAAESDYPRGLDTLAKRLTALAIALSPGEACSELLVLLEILQKIDTQLAPRIARAVHAARAAIAPPSLA
jgi:hypothetical protein